MKATKKGFMVLLSLAVFAGNSFAAHQITTWPDNWKGAVSLGFDDGCSSHLSLAVPALNARGFKGTFFLITGDGSDPNWPDWNAWRDVAAQGHEIASHTMTHPDLTAISFAQAQQEMSGAKAIINAEIPGQNGVTFAYPFGYSNSSVESYAESVYTGSKDVLWGTTCTLNGDTFDFGKLAGCSYDDGYANVYAGADAAEAQGKWVDVSTHTVNSGADGCWGDWSTTDLTNFLDYLLTKDLYVGTFGSLVKYSKERVNATLAEVSSSSSQIVLSLTDTLDDTIYDRPLTVRTEVPAGWSTMDVQQGGGAVTTIDSVLEGTTRVIYFAAVPDGGNITITALNLPSSPEVSALAPQTVTAGSPGFTLQVTGSGFVSGATVRWNGADRSTTFGSATQLQAVIPAADLVTPGTVPVTVGNPDAVVSNSMNVTVLAPALSLTGITIDGLSVLCGGDNSTYTATASWSDNTPRPPVKATWSVDPTTHAGIDASSGLLTTLPGGGTQTAWVEASFTFSGVTRTASQAVEISDCTAPPPPPETSPAGGGCAVVGPHGRAGLLDIVGSYGALILLMAWLKGRRRREKEVDSEG